MTSKSELAPQNFTHGDEHPLTEPRRGEALEDDRARCRDRVLLYMRGLGKRPMECLNLAVESLNRSGLDNVPPAMEAAWALLQERGPDLLDEDFKLASAPPMNRGVMIGKPFARARLLAGLMRRLRRIVCLFGAASAECEVMPAWERIAGRRRLLLLLLILIPSLMAAQVMYLLMPQSSQGFLGWLMVGLFALLFAWISVGFWTALAGVLVLSRRFDSISPTWKGREAAYAAPLNPQNRTALLFPVYNEDVKRVMAGIRATYHSLKATGQLEHFDIFILSDSTSTDNWVAEEEAWHRFCREENAFGILHYRRRRNNIKRKSGNIADFCRRWGKNYTYMIVFDADSVMSGDTMVKMVKIMESRQDIGILQTAPQAVNRKTLIARVQQFANHLYGPIFAAGLYYWQMGDAQYWGHNAIIRVAPFMEHCQLPRLPGRAPLGGEILSHDFVEAALMRRAGYGVWLGYDLGGSFEESPPSLLDELKRDRRWCQGNLQHSRLVLAQGFFPTHRALFINGIMSYGSALLWLLFLLCSSLQAIVEVFAIPTYFPVTKTLFPVWPVWYPGWAISVLGSTAVLLFLPKLLAVIMITSKGDAPRFGGVSGLLGSTLCEVVLSTLLAPVRMLFHSIFVVSTLMGFGTSWNAQNRDDTGTSWSDALRVHGLCSFIGVAWGALMYLVNPGFFWWLSPIIFGLAASVPLSVFTSRAGVGLWFQKRGLFLTAEEILPNKELDDLRRFLQRPEPYSPFHIPEENGFIRAVVIPKVHALHVALSLHRRKASSSRDTAHAALVSRVLEQGPHVLTRNEQRDLLSDPVALNKLHRQVWILEDPELASAWGICD